MRSLSSPALLGAALMAVGCQTPPAGSDSSSSQAATPYCAREARTGSNLPSKECAAPQSEAERRQAVENMRVKNPSTSTVKSSSGG